MTGIRTTFATPSSFLTHHSQPGEERDASSPGESHRDGATSYQTAALLLEPPDAAALATARRARN
jgi:hypothetical protein